MSTPSRVYVYGASGHGKVVADILRCAAAADPTAVPAAGFVDDRAEVQGTTLLGLPVCGDGAWLEQQAAAAPGQVGVALGIGDNRVRRRVAARCRKAGATLVTAVHPTAVVAASARVGAGSVLMAGALVNPDAQIGEGVIVNTGAVVEHDVVVGDYAHLSPNAATGGAAALGALSHLGLGAVILPMVRVGERTTVGAGSVVNRELPSDVVAYGVPARVGRKRRTR